MASTRRITLRVLYVNSDGKTCRVRDAGGFEFDISVQQLLI